MGCRRRWPGLSRSWSRLASAGPARAPEAAGGGVFAEGCGCRAGPAWLSRGRPTTWPRGARQLGRKGNGSGRVFGDRPWRWSVGGRSAGPQNRGRCLWGKVPSLAKVAAQKRPLRLLALFSSSLLRWCWLAWVCIRALWALANPPPLQTIFFFSCFTSFSIMVGLEFWIFSLWFFFVQGM